MASFAALNASTRVYFNMISLQAAGEGELREADDTIEFGDARREGCMGVGREERVYEMCYHGGYQVGCLPSHYGFI